MQYWDAIIQAPGIQCKLKFVGLLCHWYIHIHYLLIFYSKKYKFIRIGVVTAQSSLFEEEKENKDKKDIVKESI